MMLGDKLTPKQIHKKMCRTKFFFFPFRNSPRSRNAIYHQFILWVGYENWQNVVPEIKSSWESAINSFDRMYGLMVAFKDFENPSELLKEPETIPPTPPAVESFDSVTETLNKTVKIMEIFHKYEEEHAPTEIDLQCFEELFNNLAIDGEIKKIICDSLEKKIGDCE